MVSYELIMKEIIYINPVLILVVMEDGLVQRSNR